MRKTCIYIVVMVSVMTAMAQDTETGEDESSVILNNSNLGFDFGENELTFKLNNLSLRKTKSKGVLWGISAQGSSSEGIATIFTSNKIDPSSEFNFLFGYSVSNTDDISKAYLSVAKDSKTQVLKLENEFKITILKSLNDYIEDLRGRDVKTYGVLMATYNAAIIKTPIYSNLEKDFGVLSKDTNQTKEVKDQASSIVKAYFGDNPQWKLFNELSEEVITAANNFTDKLSRGYRRASVYFHYGNTATKFNTFKGWDPDTLLNSFEKVTFRGSSVGFGLNFNWGSNWIFGFRYTYQEANNLDELTSTEYKVTTTNTAVMSTGSTQVAKTAYPDSFKKGNVNNYDFDIIKMCPFGKEHILLLDLYLRIDDSNHEDNIISKSDLGLSGSVFSGKDGKFMGGIYLEIPDISQNIEKQKPEAEQKLNPFYRRATVGIFTKFSFTKLSSTVY